MRERGLRRSGETVAYNGGPPDRIQPRKRSRMKRILHISCDFDDAISADKTHAVSRLVAAADGFSHTVFSLNRSSNPFRETSSEAIEGIYALYYFALPLGIGLKSWLLRTARRLEQVILRDGLQLDVIHAHKLTYEGAIAHYLAQKLDVPFVTTFRGDTDFKLIRFKPSYRSTYRSILKASEAAFFLAPWSLRGVNALWPESMPARSVLLPNIVSGSPVTAASPATTSGRLVSVFHLKDYRRKNVERLLEAVDHINDRGTEVTLDIIGGGDKRTSRGVRKLIDSMRYADHVHMLGHMPESDIARRLPDYAGLVLPSKRETFGMVFIEALQSGLPIIHSRSTGIDGYFDGEDISLAVDPNSVASIADGIGRLLERESALKQNVARFIDAGGLGVFQETNIVATYSATIESVLQGRTA